MLVARTLASGSWRIEMADKVTAAERSRMMSAVRGSNTKPELFVRRSLHANGFRFRLHRPDLHGKPDLVLPAYGVAVFVHGCFWHGHRCNRGKLPETRKDFWERKIRANLERDRQVRAALTKAGWSVVTIWNCEIEKQTKVLIAELRHRRDQRATELARYSA